MGFPAAAGVAASGQPAVGDQANAVLSGSISAVGPTRPFAFRGPMNLALWNSVNTALTTTAGSLAATIASATGIAAGDAIRSTNVPAGTTIGVLAGTNVTLAIPEITFPGITSVGAAQIAGLPSTTGLVGATVIGLGVPSGTTVLAVTTAAIAPTGATPGGGAGSPGRPGVIQLSAAVTSAPAVTDPRPFFRFRRTGNAITETGADTAALFTGASAGYVGNVQIERSFDGGSIWVVCNLGNAGALAQYSAGTPVSVTFGEPEKNVLYRLNCTAYTSGTINYRISQTGGAAESLAIGPLSNG